MGVAFLVRANSGATLAPELASDLELAIAVLPDFALAAREHVMRRDEADRAVKAHGVVVLDELGDDGARRIERDGQEKRIASVLRVRCQRSISPFDCG